MTKTEHRDYLASEAWLQRRKIFLRTHDSCNRCGVSRKQAVAAYDQDLHVHHRNYQHVGAELDEDLEVLCRRCHEIETFGKSELECCAPILEVTGIELKQHGDPDLWSVYVGLTGYEENVERIKNARMTEYGLAGLF